MKILVVLENDDAETVRLAAFDAVEIEPGDFDALKAGDSAARLRVFEETGRLVGDALARAGGAA